MKYYTNAIGSLFGLFGGRKVIAVPDFDDIAGMPEIRIRILRIIAEGDRLLGKHFDIDPNSAIKADKIADYQERILKANGYYGNAPDFVEMRQIEEDMSEDWWLKQEKG